MGFRIATLEKLYRERSEMVKIKSFIFSLVCLFMMTAPFLYPMSGDELEINEEMAPRLTRGKVVTQIIQLPNSNTHKCQAMGVIYAPIEKVWEVISDYNHFKDFMPSISESFIVNPSELKKIESEEINDWLNFERVLRKYKLGQVKGELVYFYNRFNMPWPLKDRYYILKMMQYPENFTFRWTQFLGNTKVNDGSWELVPYKGSKRKTLGIYTLITDPGVSVSPSLMRLAMKIALPGTIKSVRKRILKLILEERKNARAQSLGSF